MNKLFRSTSIIAITGSSPRSRLQSACAHTYRRNSAQSSAITPHARPTRCI